MKKSSTLTILLSLFCFSSLAVRTEDRILVVGNVRGPGGIASAELSRIFAFNHADFTHRSSFGEAVVTVDIFESKGPGEHIQGDFCQLPLTPNSIKKIFFEWMPSSDRNLNRILVPSVEKAAQVLKPGGELIIDHHPYILSLQSKYEEALTTLKKSGALAKDIVSVVKSAGADAKIASGSLSAAWQRHDPFTVSMSMRERADLAGCLMVQAAKLDGGDFDLAHPVDTQTNYELVNQVIDKMLPIFRQDRAELMHKLVEGVRLRHSTPEVDIFDLFYGIESRWPITKQYLESLGFVNLSLTYHPRNPYNQRRHAWIIRATKRADGGADAAMDQ